MDRRFLTGKEALVLALAILALAVWLVWPKAAGAVAVVRLSGEEVSRCPLDRALRLPVQGVNGFSLWVVVEDGQVHVEGSTCPDLICQRHAPISRSGQSIVCLPGQITVTVEGGEDHGPDALAG